MCIYLRLFLGMGIIWYFEILAFALTSYKLNANIFILTDTLNMCQVKKTCLQIVLKLFSILQGVWAFIIFVCKRNVMKVVRGKSSRLYSIARQMSRQMSSQCQYFDHLKNWLLSPISQSSQYMPLSSVGGGSQGGKMGRGTLTPQSTEDKTEDMSMTASVNEAPADTRL